MASGGSFPSILNLNVGGIVYTTTLKTITGDPKSLLGRMFSGTHEVACDSKGNYFIDRDGSLFRHVLNFLRTRELCLPQPFDEFEQLSAEAEFYQVGDLIKAIQTRREGRGRNPSPSDGLGAITISDNQRGTLCLAGREELIKEVFEGSMIAADMTGVCFAGKWCIPRSITKADAFDLLYRHGFQLDGCSEVANKYMESFHEYIFGRKNKLKL